MDWMWGAIGAAVVVFLAAGIAWWLANGCAMTITGAVGAIVGGVGAIAVLAFVQDPDAAFRASFLLTAAAGVWLLAWALAAGIRGSRIAAREAADAAQGDGFVTASDLTRA